MLVRFNKKDLPEREKLLNGMAEIDDEDTIRPISKGELSYEKHFVVLKRLQINCLDFERVSCNLIKIYYEKFAYTV